MSGVGNSIFTLGGSDLCRISGGYSQGNDGVGLSDLLMPMFIHYGIFDFISYKSFCTHI
jgi:hypothetical protein